MSVLVNLQLKVKQGQVHDLLETFKGLLPGTRAYKGCHWVKLTTNIEDVNVLEVVSEWDSKEHHQRYVAFRETDGTSDLMDPLLVSPPRVRYLDLTDA